MILCNLKATTVLNNDSLLNVTMRYDEEVTRLKDFMVHLLLPITMEGEITLHITVHKKLLHHHYIMLGHA